MKVNKLLLKQISIVTFLIGGFIFLFLFFSIKSESRLNGRVVDFGATVDDTGIYSFLMVKLNDNRIIKVNYNKASKFDIGKKAIINEKTTNFFNIKRYKLRNITL